MRVLVSLVERAALLVARALWWEETRLRGLGLPFAERVADVATARRRKLQAALADFREAVESLQRR
ncbi:hypothetical protein EDD75_2224 [Thermodesulfitimonas autotrophica]|uniref:Uncharacterized protein n=1 Tax=Thermodesulfitimonas autotrophica TaxID=1894989 RepID=A0A3N5ABX3_9THEO|nr:hypothetical protein [Thermodesulfitimonas autotrophica]RPF42003.1 hypothetical protein EDD75_2224 [Thermodesulfitimonas autotrophica]